MGIRPVDGTDVTTWGLPEGATVRLGRGHIHRMAFSPDGAHLVIGTRIGCWLYDIDTMTPRALWGTERGMIWNISFSRDARWIATSDWDGVVKVWDTQDLQCVSQIGVFENPEVIRLHVFNHTFLPDGQSLAVFCFDRDDAKCAVYAWHLNTDVPVISHSIKPGLERRKIRVRAFSSDGSFFAFTSDVNVTSVIHVETGEHIVELHDDYTEQSTRGCHRLVFSPCGRYLAACNNGNSVHVWNIHNGTFEMPPTPYGGDSYIRYGIPSYTSEGTLRVAGIGGIEVVLWDAILQKTIDTFESWNPDQNSACFSTDGTRFAVANGRGDLHLWIEDTPSKVTCLRKHLQSIGQVGFLKDNQTLVSYHRNHAGVTVWDVARQQVEERRTFHFQNRNPNLPGDIVLSKNHELLATTEENEHTIKIWHLPSDAQVAELPENRRRVSSMAFSTREKYLASARRRGPIKVWDLASGTQVAELIDENPSFWVSNLVFSPSEEYVASTSPESVTVWDTLRWEKHYQVALTRQEYPGWKLEFDSNDTKVWTILRFLETKSRKAGILSE